VSASPTTFPSNQQVAVFLSAVDYQIPLTVSGLFPVSAGAQTFYLLGQSFGSGTTQQVEKAQLTLMYIPSAYGTIQATAASGPEIELESSPVPLEPSEEAYRSAADNQARLQTELEAHAIRLADLQQRWAAMKTEAGGAEEGDR
jgi:hypothetical protein